MLRAIEMASTARRLSPPNPWVGAVVVRNGVIVGEGATSVLGGPHAEVRALASAGDKSRGATLYVTLEPCCHTGRTGPCTEVIINAGITRVVAAIEDPDIKMRGLGFNALRVAGIEVEIGDGASQVKKQLAPYIWHRQTGRPFVVVKVAATLDGRVATADGSSKWITSAAARENGHHLRADSQAIVVGAATVRSDDPALTARLADRTYEPRRVVLGRVPETAQVHPCDEFEGDLTDLLDQLGKEGVLQVLVEGGPTVVSAFIEQGLVNLVVWYVAAALAGGRDGRAALSEVSTPTMEALRRGKFLDVERIGEDIRIDLEV